MRPHKEKRSQAKTTFTRQRRIFFTHIAQRSLFSRFVQNKKKVSKINNFKILQIVSKLFYVLTFDVSTVVERLQPMKREGDEMHKFPLNFKLFKDKQREKRRSDNEVNYLFVQSSRQWSYQVVSQNETRFK